MSNFKVVTYSGDPQAAKGMRKMTRKGWTVQDRTARKRMLSLGAGIFTRKLNHTVTYVR